MTKKHFSPNRVNVSAKNADQKEMLRTISQNDVTFVKGSPGSGKTFLAVGFGLQELLSEKYELLRYLQKESCNIMYDPNFGNRSVYPMVKLYFFDYHPILYEKRESEIKSRYILKKRYKWYCPAIDI